MPTEAPQIVVHEIELGVRPVRLRAPFRFGSVTLTACPELFVRVQASAGRRHAVGHAAEMMVPKWFDKRPAFSLSDNVGQLATAVRRAAAAYTGDAPATAFGLFERHHAALSQAGLAAGETALTTSYGQAVLDRAVLDALCRASGLSFFDAMSRNLPGLRATALLPDLLGFDWDGWLACREPLRALDARHTVGLLDTPASVAEAVAAHGPTHFKIKLGGQPGPDTARLAELLPVLEEYAPGHVFTLDGNEQYADGAALCALFEGLRALPALAKRPRALLYIEQPIARDRSFDTTLPWREAPAPLLMDEADGTLDAFSRGHELGWHGVSAKSCKGVYKAIANRARCQVINEAAMRNGQPARCFMSAEDLTCQAGLSVQQDLALAALLGLSHCERNGHHYGQGFNTAPAGEAQAFARAHADLYEGDPPALHIQAGRLHIDSLFAPGFAHGADPDWATMLPLDAAPTLV
jgi:hypothetical protein